MSEGFSIKEIVLEIRKENRAALEVQSTMVNSLKNIDSHLERLNSKVATQERELANQRQDISSLQAFQTKAMLIWSFVVFIVVTAVNKFL